jgi:hypothetical protein
LATTGHLLALFWLIGGLIICAAETLAPGAFLIWIGAAAAIVGAIAYFVVLDLTTQLLLFGALVVGLVLVGRKVYGSLDAGPGPLPQSRAHALIGGDFFSRSRLFADTAASGSATVLGASKATIARREPRLEWSRSRRAHCSGSSRPDNTAFRGASGHF